jgi:hypothetical protein
MGNGATTSFWLDSWVGSSPLKNRFSGLFSISSQKEAIVAKFWGGTDVGRWNFIWRHRLFVWEEALTEELVEVLQTINLTDGEDKWSWTIDYSGEFSVNSTYSFVSEMLVERVNLSKE